MGGPLQKEETDYSKRMSYMDILKRCIRGRNQRKSKGPEAEIRLVVLRPPKRSVRL